MKLFNFLKIEQNKEGIGAVLQRVHSTSISGLRLLQGPCRGLVLGCARLRLHAPRQAKGMPFLVRLVCTKTVHLFAPRP